MKEFLTISFLIINGLAFGQVFTYPTLTKEGVKMADFVPNGWTIIDSTKGDLNNDNAQDMAFIIQYNDSVDILEDGEGLFDTLHAQPRVLVICFQAKSKKKYDLIENNNTFILPSNDQKMIDPYQSIKIENGILNIRFHLFYTMGSWHVTNTQYKFRYQNSAFTLIGADNNSLHRGTMDYEYYSYNFLTKKWSLTKGNDREGNESKIEWNTLDIKELKTLKTFTRPYTWEVTKNVYL